MGLINPSKKKKRHVDNDIVDVYDDIKAKLMSKQKKSKLKELKDFLNDQKDNDEILQEIAKRTEHAFITKLLVTYTGTQSQTDLVIFDILKLYERTIKFNFKPLLPLVCGPNTETHYANLIKLGRALHICPKPDEVLKGLDSHVLWESGVAASVFDPKAEEQINPLHYDPRYISMLLLGMVQGGSDLTLRLFVEENGLSFAAFLLSHPLDNIRCYGHAILSDFLLKLLDISSEQFIEKPLFTYTLIYLKDNMAKANMRIGNASAHFFAKVFKVFLMPENPVYKKISAFLTVKPDFQLNTVPEFLRMLLSTSTETFKEERIWVLELAASSMLSANDYKDFDHVGGPSLCLSLFTSPFCDRTTMRYIFFLLQKMVSIPTGALELCHRHNFHSWLVTAMHFQSLTRWEIGFLTQIFVKYFEVVTEAMERTKAMKGTDYSRIQKIIKSCARKVAANVGSGDDEVKEKWFKKIENYGKLGDIRVVAMEE